MSHSHNHIHTNSSNIKLAFFLNLAFTIIEIVGGFLTNSVAILSDALHDLGDSISLGVSWRLERVSQRKRDEKYTYGYRRFSLLGAFINGSVLIVGSIVILFEAIPRLLQPETPKVEGMIGLAILGILFNGVAAIRLKRGKTLNEKVVSWHLWEDVLGWVGILLIGTIMLFWNLPLLDPLFSVAFTLFILYNVVKNFQKTIGIFLQAKPGEMNTQMLQEEITKIPGVMSVHDLHVWSMDGAYYVLTIHVVVEDQMPHQNILEIKQQVRETCRQMDIEHVTIEMEQESEKCALENC